MQDKDYMNLALELAARGRGWTSPNPMVGAVVVRQGRIVGRGYHEAAGKAHAEVNALAEAGAAAKGAVLYVTLEPCNHQGRTPPCTERILAAGISRVAAAMADPNPDVRGGGAEHLRRQGVAVTLGVCEAEARRLNESYLKYVRTKLPFVIVKCAATLDGRIATRTGDSRWVTGPRSRRFVHRLRHAVDGIMVGIGTVRCDDPRLTARLDGEPVRNPVRIVLDTQLSIGETARVLAPGADAATVIVTGATALADKAAKADRIRSAAAHVDTVACAVTENRIDLEALMRRLGRRGITSLLIEGGAGVIGAALRARIVDKLLFFFAPKLLGGDDGVPVCTGPGAAAMGEALRVADIRTRRFEDDVLIEGYPVY
jgi:diaminohydroxyphosphoribosylaminopyrimidine deaminase/5-amino-6-(5-phosphoribosylamino)uracil reductase